MSLSNQIIEEILLGELEYLTEKQRYDIFSSPKKTKDFVTRALKGAGIAYAENDSGCIDIGEVEIIEDSPDILADVGEFVVEGLQKVFSLGEQLFG
ncbi:MAG: hypothetical protein AAFO95_12730 [Cyanobacteria bacterium J06600_6]